VKAKGNWIVIIYQKGRIDCTKQGNHQRKELLLKEINEGRILIKIGG